MLHYQISWGINSVCIWMVVCKPALLIAWNIDSIIRYWVIHLPCWKWHTILLIIQLAWTFSVSMLIQTLVMVWFLIFTHQLCQPLSFLLVILDPNWAVPPLPLLLASPIWTVWLLFTIVVSSLKIFAFLWWSPMGSFIQLLFIVLTIWVTNQHCLLHCFMFMQFIILLYATAHWKRHLRLSHALIVHFSIVFALFIEWHANLMWTILPFMIMSMAYLHGPLLCLASVMPLGLPTCPHLHIIWIILHVISFVCSGINVLAICIHDESLTCINLPFVFHLCHLYQSWSMPYLYYGQIA